MEEYAEDTEEQRALAAKDSFVEVDDMKNDEKMWTQMAIFLTNYL